MGRTGREAWLSAVVFRVVLVVLGVLEDVYTFASYPVVLILSILDPFSRFFISRARVVRILGVRAGVL